MTKAISVRLNDEIINFMRNDMGVDNNSDAIRGVLLWLKQYQSHYLASVRSYIQDSITHNPERSSEKSWREKIFRLRITR